jgi:hypothetical protein
MDEKKRKKKRKKKQKTETSTEWAWLDAIRIALSTHHIAQAAW